MVESRGYYTDKQQYNYTHRLYDYPKGNSSTDLRNEYGKNGNSSASGRINFSTPLDKLKRLMLDLNTNASH